jgi:hypothetical protein
MNVAALLQLRAMPETGPFGWDWLSDGRRWKVNAFGSLSETRPVRHSEGNPNCPRQAVSIDSSRERSALAKA